MAYRIYPRPIAVLVGIGLPREIVTVQDAIAYLDEVPSMLRDEVYHAAHDACRDALNGLCKARDALDVFTAYARRRGILVESAPAKTGTASITLPVTASAA